MNTSEQAPQPNNEVADTKKSLIDSIKEFFKSQKPEKEVTAKDYLSEAAEKTNRPHTPEHKAKHKAQQSKLNSLKTIIQESSLAYGQNFAESIINETQRAATELSDKANKGFQTRFYQRMANLDIDDQYALPFARYIIQSSDTVQTSDMLSSAKHKTQLALEIFLGETASHDSLPTLKKIIYSIYNTHDDKDVQKYFQSDEFSFLCENYGLDKTQIKDIVNAKQEETKESQSEEDPRMDLETHKNELLAGFDSVEDRVSLDIELLSLSSDRILTLLRTVDKDEAESLSMLQGITDKKRLDKLNEPNQINRLKKTSAVNQWIDDYIAKHNYSGEKAQKLKSQVMDYYLKFRNRVYLQKMINYPRPQASYRTDEYNTWIDSLEHNIIAAELMLSSYDPFLYNEYFKGQIAGAIVKNGQLEKAIASAKTNQEFAIHDEMIYSDVMKDLHQGYLAEMSQEGDQNYARTKGNITSSINRMKMEKKTKQPVSFGRNPFAKINKNNPNEPKQLDITFLYSRNYEDSSEGGYYTEKGFFANRTLAHMTAVYPKTMDELKMAFSTLNEIVKIAESKGDAEGLTEASAKMTNDLMDAIKDQAPLAYVAMQSYLRIIRQKLASNGMVLTPDMFGSTSYVKSEFSKILEMEIKNAHDITDFEKDVYLKMGMGLAFASSEMQSVLSNALPPMVLKINELPPSILKKVMNGEMLTIKEQKALQGEFAPTFRDFKYRGLLMNINPLMWLHTWIKYNDYQVFNLAFNPLKTGKNAIDPLDNYKITQDIMFSAFLGLSEDAVEYFDGTYHIPAIELARLNQKMSVEKRGGVRDRVKQLLRKDFVVYKGADGIDRVDGDKAFAKLLKQSPILAYGLLTDKHIADNAHVYWQNQSVETSKLSAAFKEEKIKELLDYMHIYYPTFFANIEQPMHFRRKELSFSQAIRDRILTDMGSVKNRDDGYWLLLNNLEADEAITESADIHPLGKKYMHENIIGTKRINERLNIIMMELQTYLQEKGDRDLDKRKNLMEFFRAKDQKEYDSGLFKSLDTAVDNVIELYYLQKSDKDKIRQLVVKYAQDMYYGKSEANDQSLYHQQKFLGNTKLNKKDSKIIKDRNIGLSIPDDIIERNGSSIRDYYAKLINNRIIVDPFDWAYLDRTQLNFQATGLKMIGRNTGDYSHGYLPYASAYMGAVEAIQDAISQPEQSKKIITEAIDKFSDSVHGINNAYSSTDGAQAGWLATAFLTYPFIASRLKDTPLLGKLPLLHSWATMVNHDDRRHLNAWDSKTRKEVLDHVLQKPWSKAILQYLQDNKKLESIKTHFNIGKIKVPIPKMLRGLFGRTWEEPFKPGTEDYSIKSLKSFLKVEDWWTGGKDNFGLGLNTLMTIALIGFLLMMLQAIKEGMKEVEIK